jgi:DNA-binding NarL/FixJ family response regulator
MAYRILLVDDHAVVREGFKRLLDDSTLTICGEAANGAEAIEKVLALKPDLVLMDLSMPVMGGIEATRQIRQLSPATKVIVVSLHDSQQAVQQAKSAGASAYVVKTRSAAELIEVVKAVLGKETFEKPAPSSPDTPAHEQATKNR